MSIIGRGLVRSEPGRAQPGSEGCFDAARPRAFPDGRARGGQAAPLNHALTSPAPVPAEPALRVQFCFRLQGEANNSSQAWVCIAFGPCAQPAFQPRGLPRVRMQPGRRAGVWPQARSAQGPAPEPVRLARTYRPQEHARPREGSAPLGRK